MKKSIKNERRQFAANHPKLRALEANPIDIPLPPAELAKQTIQINKGNVSNSSTKDFYANKLAYSWLYLVFIIISIVALARFIDIGWTPRYITLFVILIGAVIMVVAGTSHTRNTKFSIDIQSKEYTPISSSIDKLPFEGIKKIRIRYSSSNILQHQKGDIKKAHAMYVDEIHQEQSNIKIKLEDSLDSRTDYNNLTDSISRLGDYSNDYLTVEDIDGNEWAIATMPHDSYSIPKLLAAASIIKEQNPIIPSTVELYVRNYDSIISNSSEVKETAEWTLLGGHRYYWESSAFALTTSCAFAIIVWQMFLSPGVEFANFPGPRLLNIIYSVSPIIAMAPILIAAFKAFYQQPTLIYGSSQSKPYLRIISDNTFQLVVSILFTVCFFGGRFIDFNVSPLIVISILLPLVIGMYYSSHTAIVLACLLRGASKYLEKRKKQRSVNTIGGNVEYYATYLAALGIMCFFVFLLGRLGDTLMGLEPAGGGGKTAIPIYFDIIFLALMARFGSASISTRWLVPYNILIGFGVITVVHLFAIPGMSQLNDLAIVVYLMMNTMIAYMFLKES